MTIELHRAGDLLEIRLARPPVNALVPALLDALATAVRQAPADGARGIVLAGGPGVFSAGMDVPHLVKLPDDQLGPAWMSLFDAARALAASPLPVVAAIGGHSPAGGCVLALCCDYRIMARGPFRIGLNEVQVGLVAPDAIQHLMRRVVGPYRAERLLVPGALVDAEQALSIGLVDELVDAGDVTPRAQAWLQDLLKLPEAAMRATRRIARADMVAALEGFTDETLAGFLAEWHSPATQAALQALVARLGKSEPPVATGRAGSLTHPLHDGAYTRAPGSPACSIASSRCAAVTPDPHCSTTRAGGVPSSSASNEARSSAGGRKRPSRSVSTYGRFRAPGI